jgi:tRNA pseudouridine55 synthase
MARRKKCDPVHGFLNFYKPKGMSSNAAVGYVRHVFNAQKAGHGGTLDPLAEGLLPIALGEATKTLSYMLAEDKFYQFEITFGSESETDDAEGHITHTSEKRPNEADLLEVLKSFEGEIQQTPPVYSALKINGKRACDRVRNGEDVKLIPRKVTIYDIQIDSFDQDKATLSVHVSKGTYVRSLCRDIGRALGCYAYVTKLMRTKVPPFHINEAITQEKLDLCIKMGQSAKTYLLDVDCVLDDIPVYNISDEEVKTILSGQPLTVESLGLDMRADKTVRVKTKDGVLVSLAQLEGNLLKPNKNFPLLLKNDETIS